MNCKNCGSALPEGSLFCNNCGTKLETENQTVSDSLEMNFCQQCGEKLKKGAFFCNKCGAAVNGVAETAEQEYQERKYTFKNIQKYTLDVSDIIFGGRTDFRITNNMLVIREETYEKFPDKVTGIPYNEIASFKIRYRFSIWLILIALVMIFIVSLWLEDDDILSAVFGIAVIAASVFNSVYSVFVVNVVDGRRFKIKLKRIGFRKKKEKEDFIADLNRTIGSTYILQNITQKQSGIKACGTNVNWNTLSTDWLR